MILLINICKEPLHALEFVGPIEDILKNNSIKYIAKHYLKLKSSDIHNANKIIICGTSLRDNDFLKHINKFRFLLTFNKPVLGICGGAHIIGLLLGHKKVNDVQIGFKKVDINNFLGVNGAKEVYHLHQFHVLPEVFHEKNFYATLFHPEVRNKEMIVNFCRL